MRRRSRPSDFFFIYFIALAKRWHFRCGPDQIGKTMVNSELSNDAMGYYIDVFKRQKDKIKEIKNIRLKIREEKNKKKTKKIKKKGVNQPR